MNAGLGLIYLIGTVSCSMLAAGKLLSGSTFDGVCAGVAATVCALMSALSYRRAHQGSTDTRSLYTVILDGVGGRSRRKRGRIGDQPE